MIKIQTDLNNFSVAEDILSTFAGFQRPYGITIQAGMVLPDTGACPLCSTPLSKNGYNVSQDRRAQAFGLKLKKGRVVCPNSECSFSLNIPQGVFEEWFSRLSNWLESIILSLKTKKMSAGDIAQHIKETCPIPLSGEYVRLKAKELIGKLEKPTIQYEPGGVVVHDEQFVTVKGIDLKRNSAVDANNPNVYYDDLETDRTEETISKNCQKLKDMAKKLYAVVMDGNQAAIKAYKKTFANILIQYCIFHFSKNVRDAYKEEFGCSRGRTILPLEHLIGFFSIINVFFDHEREIAHLRNLQADLIAHIERINKGNSTLAKKQDYIKDYKENYAYKAAKYLKKIRNARRRKQGIHLALRTEEQAKQLLRRAKMENVFPRKVQKQINRLERDWENFTHCMRDSSIPPTSNKVEQFYALTLNWIAKNNLQSQEEFYQHQKVSLMIRYGIPLIKPGIFTDLLDTTFVLLFAFGGT